MNIVYATDANYAPICGVSMFSLLMNNQDVDEINIYLLEENIGKEKDKFIEMVNQFGRNLFIITAVEVLQIFQQLKVPKVNGSYASYFRLGIHQYLKEIEKVLYIDCDTLILDNLQELYSTDLENHSLAAVCDGMSACSNLALKREKSDKYYNAGILLIDLFRWRKENKFERLLDSIKEVDLEHTATASDQELINYALGKEIKKLPLKYNVQVQNRMFHPQKFRFMIEKDDDTYYSIEEMQEAISRPYILHFASSTLERPWYINSLDPEKARWDSYLQRTPWKDFQHTRIKQTKWRKVCIIAYKRLPKSLYCHLKKYEARMNLWIKRKK